MFIQFFNAIYCVLAQDKYAVLFGNMRKRISNFKHLCLLKKKKNRRNTTRTHTSRYNDEVNCDKLHNKILSTAMKMNTLVLYAMASMNFNIILRF